MNTWNDVDSYEDYHLFNLPEPKPKPRPVLDVVECLEPDRAYSIRHVPKERDAIGLWALDGEGNTFLSRTHISNVRGRKTVTYLKDKEVPEVKAARKAVQELTGIENVGWTQAALARTVTRWLDIGDWNGGNQPIMIPSNDILPHWHYQYCDPCEWDETSLYDMTAAYWNIAIRAKSPVFDIHIDKRSVSWRCISEDQEERWQTAARVLVPHKRLRLAIIGVNACGWRKPGAYIEQRYFHRGRCKAMRFPPGPLQPLAMLTVRAAYELTQIQAQEAKAYYANSDSVVLMGQQQPTYWRDAGLAYRLVARGKTCIHALGAYRVGDKETIPYEHSAILDTCRELVARRVSKPDWHLHLM